MSLKFTSPLLAAANRVAEEAVARASATVEVTKRSSKEAPPATLSTSGFQPAVASDSALRARAENVANVKGINFTTLLLAVDKVHRQGAAERVRVAIGGSAGHALRYGGLVVGGWYPVEWYQELWTGVQTALQVGDEGARQIGACAAEIGVNRVYRTFARLASPLMLMRIASAAFNSYYDTGSLQVRLDGANSIIAEWKGCTGFNSLLWADLLGGAQYFLGSTGVSDVKITPLSGGGNENWLVARGSWR